MRFIFSEKCIEYWSPGHPESPERVEKIYKLLKSKGFEFEKPSLCEEQDILRVHSKELLAKVRKGKFSDPDTPVLPKIYEYARLAAGGAILACEVSGFSIMRPPGHHAGKNFLGGFCYFNNMAIAVAKSGRKTAIIDIDCHHGNGTEDIFSGNPRVLYVSLHRYGFFYPGTGQVSLGDESKGNSRNYPLSFGIDEKEYLQTFKNAIKEIKRFNPEIIGVSVGFDTYKLDPVGGLGLEIGTYKKIGELIREIGLPTFYVLEGGYSADIEKCMWQLIG